MTPETTAAARQGYLWCRNLARSHYENFPVASWLLPARMRSPIAALYAFARLADDIADEGREPDRQRLQRLDAMAAALRSTLNGTPPDEPLYQALADTLRRYPLPPESLYDLLHAFRQDVTTSRYASYSDVMNYCRYSANPVGRLLLHLAGQASETRLERSDAICSALQWINFLQDIGQDYRENNRIYLPVDEMQRFGASEEDIRRQRNSPQMRDLFRFQVERTERLLRAGSELGSMLPGRFGLEIRAVVLAANRVLDKLARQHDVFARPRLNILDKARISWAAITRAGR